MFMQSVHIKIHKYATSSRECVANGSATLQVCIMCCMMLATCCVLDELWAPLPVSA